MKKLVSLLLALAMLLAMTAFSVSALEEYEQNWDVQLVLGDNNLTLSTAAVTTVYEFLPEETGTYKFEVADANAQLSYWGGNSFFVWNQSETTSNVLVQSHTQVGPSIMVGVSGVESCTLTVTRTGDAVAEPTIENVDYVNQVTPEVFTFSGNAADLKYVNVTDDQADAAVLGEDGYYHLNSADGPILYVNISGSGPYGAPLYSAAGYGAVKVGVYDENGKATKLINYLPAWEAYTACMDKATGLYPLTVDLMTMYQQIGNDPLKGWYDMDTEMGIYLFGEDVVNEETAWMFSCCYIPAAEIKGDMTADSQVNNDDVVYLLWHTLFADQYPISVDADFTGDDQVNNDDVVYLLWHTLFADQYPL